MKCATRQLTFQIADNTAKFIDLAECLSLVNRRLYKQGALYGVESFSWRAAVAGLDMDVISIPTNWAVFQSWVKAKFLWDKVNRQPEIDRSQFPKYHDFKVFFDAAHYVSRTSISTNQLPIDGGGALFSNIGREWDYSQYVSADASPPQEDACHMLGGNSVVANAALGTDGSFGIIQGYSETRVTVGAQEPELPGDASVSWQTNLFPEAEINTDILHHLENVNDRPPYGHALDLQGGDNPIYVGGSESGTGGHQMVLIAPQATESAYAPGGEVPCGLLKIQPAGPGTFTVNMSPGSYNGVAAIPMGKVET